MLFMNVFTDSIRQFLFETGLLEWAGVFTGILCVWLAAKNNIWNWPIAVVSVLIYIFIFFESKLYADMGLQFYFFGMNIYGWYYWSKHRNNPEASRPIRLMSKNEMMLSMIGALLFTLILGFALHKNTDAAFPFIDSFCTACSLIAQLFLARKVLQNWLIWIFVDLLYVGVYMAKDLYATGLMYLLYVGIAAMGYADWRKIYREQKNEENSHCGPGEHGKINTF